MVRPKAGGLAEKHFFNLDQIGLPEAMALIPEQKLSERYSNTAVPRMSKQEARLSPIRYS
jgi:hypothetical protein